MEIFIFEEGGHCGPRTENPYRIMVDGKVFETPEGYSSFWTEADALRACAKYFTTIPQERPRYIHKSAVPK